MEQRGALATISPDEIQSKMYSDQWKKTLASIGRPTCTRARDNSVAGEEKSKFPTDGVGIFTSGNRLADQDQLGAV